jgi:hypothetical protein
MQTFIFLQLTFQKTVGIYTLLGCYIYFSLVHVVCVVSLTVEQMLCDWCENSHERYQIRQ